MSHAVERQYVPIDEVESEAEKAQVLNAGYRFVCLPLLAEIAMLLERGGSLTITNVMAAPSPRALTLGMMLEGAMRQAYGDDWRSRLTGVAAEPPAGSAEITVRPQTKG